MIQKLFIVKYENIFKQKTKVLILTCKNNDSTFVIVGESYGFWRAFMQTTIITDKNSIKTFSNLHNCMIFLLDLFLEF